MKKVLRLLLAVTVLVTAMSAVAYAADSDYKGKTVILYTGNIRGDVDVYPQIAQAKKDYQDKGADVILADAGNSLQGSAIANADRGLTIYNLMDAAGYDIAAMGLAEFGYTDATTGYVYHGNFLRYYTQAMLQAGTEEVSYNQNRDGSVKGTLAAKSPAGFQTICSNVQPNDAYSFQPWAEVTTKSGLAVRFLGMADPAAASLVQDGFVSVDTSAVTQDSPAGVTVILSNDPGSAEGENVIRVAADSGFTVGALVIDNAAGTFSREKVVLNSADKDVAELAAAAKAREIKVVGKSEVILCGADSENWNKETNLGDLTADALKWYAENHMDGVDSSYPVVAIQNGGNCDNFLYTGEITETDLLRALPFSPMGFGVLQVTGAQLLETIEAADQKESCPGFAQVAGLTYTLNTALEYDGGEAYGNFFKADSVGRVTITSINGQAFDPAATYNLVCDNFLMNGNDTYYTLAEIKGAEGAQYVNNGGGVKTRDAVAMYIEQVLGGVIGKDYAQPQGRISVISNPEPEQPVSPPAAEKPAVSITEAPKAETYTVKKGDTLWGIAKAIYGSGTKYKDIFEANRDSIRSPSLIFTGQLLVLP